MSAPSYHTRIITNASAAQVSEDIRNIQTWWATTSDGEPKQPGDSFTINFGSDWVRFHVAVDTARQIIWKVEDCNLDLIEDSKEWNNTRLIWNISEKNNQTTVHFTHEGMTSDKECYTDCRRSWNFYLNKCLHAFLQQDEVIPAT